jgi:hypothetical protein
MARDEIQLKRARRQFELLPRELTEVGRHLPLFLLYTLAHSGDDMGSSTSSKVQYISPDVVAQLVLATPKRNDYLIIGNLSLSRVIVT